MKILVARDAVCGKIQIPRGEYMVSLSAESNEIFLAGGGRNIKVPATKRKQRSKSKVTTVQFYSGGGPVWSFIIGTPKHGEWIAMIEYVGGK